MFLSTLQVFHYQYGRKPVGKMTSNGIVPQNKQMAVIATLSMQKIMVLNQDTTMFTFMVIVMLPIALLDYQDLTALT